jgi:hypothetical protein
MMIEIRDAEFEFYQHGKPTGHYARGEVIEEYSNKYKVKLFCNGKTYQVDKCICIAM